MPCISDATIRGRLDHDDGVDLEALGHADRHDGDLIVEPGGGGPAVGDAGVVERARDLVDHRVGGDDGDAAVAAARRQHVVGGGRHGGAESRPATSTLTTRGMRVALADRCGDRRSGVAARMTRSASCMICAGMR